MPYRCLEPKWRNYRCLRRCEVPPNVMSWILDLGSTTSRFQKENKKAFAVNLLCHKWHIPRHSECVALGMKRDKIALIREVELTHDDQVWMYARSVFPMRSLVGKGQCLRHLGTRPLGKILFADPLLQRSEFAISKLRPGHHGYLEAIRHVANPPPSLWARRSVFRWYGKPALVSEVFLVE